MNFKIRILISKDSLVIGDSVLQVALRPLSLVEKVVMGKIELVFYE